MSIDRDIASRIDVLRPLLIFGVVFLHVPGQVDKPSLLGDGWFDYATGFFQIGLFRATVPTLTLIAGFLLFRAGLDLTPGRLYRKKGETIGIPFLVFNVALALLGAALQAGTGFVFLRDLQDAAPRDWINALFGIKAVPYNYPLYFLRDLMALILMAPLFGWFLRRRPWIGLAAVALVFGAGLDGFLVRRDTSAILFYLGGWLALSGRDLRAADRLALPCLIALVLLCAAPLALRVDDNTALVLAAPFLIWPAVSLLQGTAAWNWALRLSKYSFFVFVGHAPLLELSYCCFDYQRRWGLLSYELYWLLGPLCTIALLIALYELAVRLAPRAFNLAIGARARVRVAGGPARDGASCARPSAEA